MPVRGSATGPDLRHLFFGSTAFGTLRSGGFGKRLFLGIVFGIGYFTLQTLTVNMAEVFRFDLRLGNALPPLIVTLLSWLYFRRRSIR